MHIETLGSDIYITIPYHEYVCDKHDEKYKRQVDEQVDEPPHTADKEIQLYKLFLIVYMCIFTPYLIYYISIHMH